jgi:hypothetical protein
MIWTITDSRGSKRWRVLGYRRAVRAARRVSLDGRSAIVCRKRIGRLHFIVGPSFRYGRRDDLTPPVAA